MRAAPLTARYSALAMAVGGVGLLVYATVDGARFELVIAALGLSAGAALVGLLAHDPGVAVRRPDDRPTISS